MNTYIYALFDPNDYKIKYVGKTDDLVKRMRRLMTPWYVNNKWPVCKWLKTLKDNGQKPLMIPIENCRYEDWQSREQHWISVFKPRNILNIDKGGLGHWFTGKKHSQESIDKMRNAQKGRKWAVDDHRRVLLSEKQKGIAPMHATVKAIEVNTRYWMLVDPIGNKHYVRNVKEFAKKHNLISSKLYSVAKGSENRTHHKKWKCEEITEKEYSQLGLF